MAHRLSKEISNISGKVIVGTLTDPYQYAERRFRLTQMCLEVLSKGDMAVSVATKSDLVTRDSELLASLDATVFMGISGDDTVSTMYEPGAPPFSSRLAAAERLVDAGVRVVADLSGLEPATEDDVRNLVSRLSEAGIRNASTVHLKSGHRMRTLPSHDMDALVDLLSENDIGTYPS